MEYQLVLRHSEPEPMTKLRTSNASLACLCLGSQQLIANLAIIRALKLFLFP